MIVPTLFCWDWTWISVRKCLVLTDMGLYPVVSCFPTSAVAEDALSLSHLVLVPPGAPDLAVSALI